ncbi:hypothetical protein [Miniphocaeibacter massiliensis]|uniref:hypothetical protein n=1 Tax=Miniphocaeibacter massiliensis TaxID=2041841 RepID=UPI000C071979|nr:hypothetical protein [Miniphocaeibacter massiliensis]
MGKVINIFDNRELAGIIIIVFIILMVMMFAPSENRLKILRSLVEIVREFLHKKIITLIFIIIMYLIIALYFLIN